MATAWDLTLRPTEHAELSLARFTAAPYRFAAQHQDGRICAMWLSPSPWDAQFFGVPMATLGLEGAQDSGALEVLLPLVIEEATRLGLVHLRISMRTGSHGAIEATQAAGFRVRWVSAQITCDTRRLKGTPNALPDGLECHEAEVSHLAALEGICDQLAPYCWPELDPALPNEAREGYVMERVLNCVTTDYADSAQVLLWRGRVVGFHASKLQRHDLTSAKAPPFAYVRDTFVSPTAPPTTGVHLIRQALLRHVETARQVTGRVRLDGLSMLNAALSNGYSITGDELLLSMSLKR